MQRNWSNTRQKCFWPPPTTDPSHVSCLMSHVSAITWVLVATLVSASFFVADKVGVEIETFGAVTFTPTILVQHYDDPDFL
jgi:hypothetical protein